MIFAFTVFSFIDCVRTEESRIRALPKILWAILIVILPTFGGVLWFVLGKERSQGTTLRPPVAPRSRGPVAPDDDPVFMQKLNEDKQRELRIRDLEARLAELDDDHPGTNDK